VQTSLAARLRTLDQKRNRLVDAYLGGRGIDQRTYERQSKRLDDDEAEASRRLDVAMPAGPDLRETIDLAKSLPLDLPGCWNRLSPQYRSEFVAALYPAGLVYQDGSIGTAQNPWWIAVSVVETEAGDGLVPPTGFEPVLPA
jgi:hypothetical protein